MCSENDDVEMVFEPGGYPVVVIKFLVDDVRGHAPLFLAAAKFLQRNPGGWATNVELQHSMSRYASDHPLYLTDCPRLILKLTTEQFPTGA